MSNAYYPQGGGFGSSVPGVDPQTLAVIQYLLQSGGGQGGQGMMPSGNMLDQLSFGYDPTQYEASMLNYMPGMTESDMEDPLAYMKDAANFQQDRSDLMTDPATFLAGGPGTYSADAFAPEVTMELIPRPETIKFQQYAQMGDNSFEGYIAKRVMEGATPRQAITEMREMVDAGTAEGADEDQKAAAEMITRWLPADNLSGEIDWTRAFDDATTLATPFLDEQALQIGPVGPTYDPATGQQLSSGGEIVEGPDGQLYRQTTTPSPLAEQLREMGFSDPNENYTAEDFLGPQWSQAASEYEAQRPAMEQAMRTLEGQMRQAQLADPNAIPSSLAGEGMQGGRPVTAAQPEAAATEMVGPTTTATGVPDDVLAEGLSFTSSAQLRSFMEQHPELSGDQLDQLQRRAQDLGEATPYGSTEQQALITLASDIGTQQDAIQGPNAVTRQTMDVGELAQGRGQIAAMADMLPFGRNRIGGSVDDFSDPRAAEQWMLDNWSTMTPEERVKARDSLAARVDMNANVPLEADAGTGMQDSWARALSTADRLLNSTEIIDWNAQQTGEAGGGGRSRKVPAGLTAKPTDVPPNPQPPGLPGALAPAAPESTMPWDQPGLNENLPWNQTPTPPSPPQPGAPTISQTPPPRQQATLPSPGNIGQTAAMLQYLLNGQGGDYLYNQQMGLQGSTPPRPPAEVGPRTTQPAFNQAGLAALVGGGGGGAPGGAQTSAPLGPPSLQQSNNQVAGASADYWSTPSWQRDYTQVPGTPGWMAGQEPAVASTAQGPTPEATQAMISQLLTPATPQGRVHEPGRTPATPQGRVHRPETDWQAWYDNIVEQRGGSMIPATPQGRAHEPGRTPATPQGRAYRPSGGPPPEGSDTYLHFGEDARPQSALERGRENPAYIRLARRQKEAERRQLALQREVYGHDYAKAFAMQEFLKERGIKPFTVQWATRSGALQRTGV